MTRFGAPLVLLVLSLAGCSTPEERIVGTWTGWDGVAKVTVEITKDHQIKNGAAVTPFTIKSVEGDTVTIVSKSDNGELEEKLTVTGDKMRIRIPELGGNQREMKLTRVTP